MTPPVIEAATGDDVEAILTHWVRLAHDQRTYGSDILAEENRQLMREVLSAHRFDGRLLVARVDGDLAGFASFSVEDGSMALESTRGLLSNLYVRPLYRNRGIGTKLLDAVERELDDRGVDDVLLEVMAGNEAARRFYREAGYDQFRVTMKRSLSESRKNDTPSKDER